LILKKTKFNISKISTYNWIQLNYYAFVKKAIVLAFFCSPLILEAENPSKKSPLAPYFQLDTYYSFIGNKSADVWGFKAGITWKKKWHLAVGYNKIRSDIIELKMLPESEWSNSNVADHKVKAQLYLRYYPIMAEYVFYDKDPWQLSAPVSIGYGRSYFQYFDKANNPRSIFSHGVLVNDLGINAQYRIIKWVGIGGGLGYRLMLVKNPEVDTKFNSPIISFRIKLYLGEIVKSLFPNSKFIKDKS
jgi:hypothetical protein